VNPAPGRGTIALRRAGPDDAAAVAAVYSPSYRLLTFLPALHTADEDREFIAGIIFKECEVTVAELAERIVAFLARDGEEVRLLYTHPDFIGRSAGGRLLEAAKQEDVEALELWCFQANTAGRRFYEAHGFKAIALTDGSGNEEKTPDVRYRWERTRTPRKA